jgi:hypothetical protein
MLARVPNLVAFGEMVEDGVVQKSVCVREHSMTHSLTGVPALMR